MQAERLPNLLDVLHEYDCGGLRRAPCIRAALRRLATNQCEKCGLELGDRGQLAPGLLADIIAVRGYPTQRIEAMRDVSFVMKGGVVYQRP